MTDTPAIRRPSPRDVLRTLSVFASLWLALILFVLLLGPYLLLAGVTFNRSRSHARLLTRAIFPTIIRFFCRLEGKPFLVDPLPPGVTGPCIVVANHGSMMDSVLLMALPRGLGDGRIWAKTWPFKVPLLGALMRLSGHLFVDDFNLLPDAESCLADGSSLLVFPESSRTRSGKLGRFRDGAFLLAARTNTPILPVAIRGSFKCLPPGQSWIFEPILRVIPLALLHPDPADPRSHLALKRQAHDLIAQALDESLSQPAHAPPAAA